ncbi:flagellar protein FlaG [Paradesulfitobacterium ferrireducens]|uniref:flagellar protein FlaG n=1 Tax=Paradesulfitobacterium ferrireducens TaxID=2816476 RepID=UPI001A8C993B|nr:flagellar protein FlaG [Paradesulfitobacterium ferrireducens]
MVNPVQPNTPGATIMPLNTFPGQKMERSKELPRPVVDRKQEVGSAREEISREEVEKAIDKINRLMGIIEKRLEFSIHDGSHRVMVKVVDKETGKVLDEVPPKKILDMLSSFNEMAGLLLDKRL